MFTGVLEGMKGTASVSTMGSTTTNHNLRFRVVVSTDSNENNAFTNEVKVKKKSSILKGFCKICHVIFSSGG